MTIGGFGVWRGSSPLVTGFGATLPPSLPLPTSLPADESTRAGLERLSALARSWTRRLDQNVFLLKTDHYIGNASRLSIRYNHHDFNGVNFETGGPQMTIDHNG